MTRRVKCVYCRDGWMFIRTVGGTWEKRRCALCKGLGVKTGGTS